MLQANVNDENMQDYDDQQPSEKDIVQPEYISNAPTEKCLENVGRIPSRPLLMNKQFSQNKRFREPGVTLRLMRPLPC
ncbi:hypothetical protein TNCV_3871111 [Trichonephila clavipes]|nr:hypothetical protein TNCV_3871111 [Trichonephila clavipes]